MNNKKQISNKVKNINKITNNIVNKIKYVDEKEIKNNNKKNIINLFLENVKGKKIVYKNIQQHNGNEGHWLENQMNIPHNSYNKPDIFGFEMKKESKKITFGDFSASEYLFSKKKRFIEIYNDWKPDEYTISRTEFIKYFGSPNPLKNNRYSWSGSCVPTYGEWNKHGQKLIFNENLDLCIYYSFKKDNRTSKISLPEYIKHNIIIAFWEKTKLEKHINDKFNVYGFFICKKNKNINNIKNIQNNKDVNNENNTYEKICFGKPFNYMYFVENIKNKNIIFDSGMYEGNTRNYSHFRSSINNFWNKLIIEEY